MPPSEKQEITVNEAVLVSKPEPMIAVITLNRPFRLNAMNAELMSGIYAACTQVSNDNECRAIILTGNGRAFCSGLDLEDAGMVPNIDGLTVPRLAMRAIEHFAGVVPAMIKVRQPIIAAIKGPAYGGGFCLAMGADIRIAGESAIFNSTGIINGLTSTELGVSWLLPRLVGASWSSEMMLTGRAADAQEALKVGLVSRVVADDEVMDTAMEIARGISRLSPHGVAMTKEAIWASLQISSFDAAMSMENRNQLLLGMTTNLEEAITARKESRKPVYLDKPHNWPDEW